jgi:hypothetical protein
LGEPYGAVQVPGGEDWPPPGLARRVQQPRTELPVAALASRDLAAGLARRACRAHHVPAAPFSGEDGEPLFRRPARHQFHLRWMAYAGSDSSQRLIKAMVTFFQYVRDASANPAQTGPLPETIPPDGLNQNRNALAPGVPAQLDVVRPGYGRKSASGARASGRVQPPCKSPPKASARNSAMC